METIRVNPATLAERLNKLRIQKGQTVRLKPDRLNALDHLIGMPPWMIKENLTNS